MRTITRYIIALLLFSSFAYEAVSQDLNAEKFNKGVAYYTSGSYKEALQVWTDIYNTGARSASLDFNIGNAWFKLNNIPNAILFYERAYLMNPAGEDINYNLQIARTLIVDRFQEIPELFFIRWYNFMALLLSTNNWAQISMVSFILSLLFLSLYIYSSKYRQKVTGFWFAVFFFVLTIASFSFTVRNKSLVFDSHRAIITSSLVNGKSSPDNSGSDLFVLHEGTKVSIEDGVGEWYEIRLSDGNKGWVPANCLNII